MPQRPLYALLIGINRYASSAVPDLRGCVNDVEAMATLLRERYAVPPAQITLLTNEAATHAAIAAAFQSHLMAPLRAWSQAGESDEKPAVLFYFSGHGSRALAVTRETSSGFDETLVPHDSRTNHIYDIKDWELKEWLNGVTAYTDNVTVILDCCHSGSGTRLTEKRITDVRGCDDDLRPQPSRPSTRSGATWVSLGACRNDQKAHEAQFESAAQLHGVFTYWLLETLAQMSPHRPLTYRELYEQLLYRVGRVQADQTPQCEGSRDRLWLGGVHAVQERWLSLLPPRDGLLWVNAGQMHGLVTGTQLKVYPPGTPAPDEAGLLPLALLAIDTVEATQSGCVRVATSAEIDIPPGARVIVDWNSAALNRTRLALVNLNEGLAKIIRERLLQNDSNPWLVMVLADEPCDLRLVQTREQLELQDREQQLIQRYDLRKLNPYRGGWGKPGYYDPIVKDLLHIIQYEKISGIQNWGSAEIAQTLTVVAERLAVAPITVATTSLSVDEQKNFILPAGAALVLTVTHHHPLPLYLTVLRLDASFRVTRLWPTVAGLNEALAPGQKIVIGRSATVTEQIVMELPSGVSSRKETFKIFASLDETDFDYFLQSALPSQPTVTPPLPKPRPTTTASQRITRAYQLGGGALPEDKWGAIEIHVKVVGVV